jgi:hypothetical protein
LLVSWVAPLRRKTTGAFTPKTPWLHYAGNPVAPLRRKRNGAYMPEIHMYADWLAAQPDETDRQRARELYAEIVHDAKHWPRHAREHNSEWLQRAQASQSR